jgi:hypothetical protein
MKNLAHSASFESLDKDAPSKPGIKHLGLVASIPAFKIGGASAWDTPTPASVIALNGGRIECTAFHIDGRLWLENLSEPIVGGMSGSPVLDQAGGAIGLLSQSSTAHGITGEGMAPLLIACLPGQLLINLGAVEKLKAERRFTQDWYLS